MGTASGGRRASFCPACGAVQALLWCGSRIPQAVRSGKQRLGRNLFRQIEDAEGAAAGDGLRTAGNAEFAVDIARVYLDGM